MERIRKYFFRSGSVDPYILITAPDPDLGDKLTTDSAGESYMGIFPPNENKCCKIVINHQVLDLDIMFDDKVRIQIRISSEVDCNTYQ